MNKPRKFCVIVARFSITGVPLAQIRLAEALAARGYAVDVIFGYVPPNLAIPKIDGARVLIFGKNNVRGIVGPMMSYLRHDLPDVVFSAEDHLNIVVIAAAIIIRSKVKISASSRVTPHDTYAGKPFQKGWVLKQAMRALMWRADALTCVSYDMVAQYKSIFNDVRHVCVYNIIDPVSAADQLQEDQEDEWFDDQSLPVCVAAGQMGPWKGFDYLIRAIGMLSTRLPVRLILLGDGDQRSELEDLVQDLGITDRVRFEGNVANPLKYFKKADVFVLSSLLEGMPNVLIEAMMAGCTPVATDCPTGPREILESGRYGYLVEMRNPAALAAGIEQALNKPILPEVLQEAIRPFEENTVIEKHFEVLELCQK